MAEEPSSAPAKPVKKFRIPAPVMIALVVVAIYIISVMVLRAQVTAARRTAFAQGVDALASTLEKPLIARDKVGLQDLATGIAQAGHYERVTIAEQDGTVLASTETLSEGKKLDGLSAAPTKTEIKTVNGRWRATRGVFIGGNNRVGALLIEETP